MIERLREVAGELAGVAEGFDPAVLDGEGAAQCVRLASRVEHIAASLRTLAARRVDEVKVWKGDGHASAADWLANEMGTTRGHAKRTLELGEQLLDREKTRTAFAAGELSEQQAGIIAGAAAERPRTEKGLIETARTESVRTLKAEAARARARSGDEEGRQARIHERRYGASGTDEEGAYRLSARMAAFQGGIFDTIWRRFREHVVREARARSERLGSGQVGADALVLMAQTALEALEGEAPLGGVLPLPQVSLHLLVDLDALQRCRTEEGERCEIDGLGPVSVTEALRLCSQGAFVTASLTDGRDVFRVAHLGTLSPETLDREKVRQYLAARGVEVQGIAVESRHVPAVLDTALTVRDRVCRHPGCDRRLGLQRDHVLAYELGGLTSYQNLQRLCWYHHREKTRRDLARIAAARRAGRPPRAREPRAGPAP